MNSFDFFFDVFFYINGKVKIYKKNMLLKMILSTYKQFIKKFKAGNEFLEISYVNGQKQS